MNLAQAVDGDFELNTVYEYSAPESTTLRLGPGENTVRYVTFEKLDVPAGLFADRTVTIDVDRTALADGTTPQALTLQQVSPARTATGDTIQSSLTTASAPNVSTLRQSATDQGTWQPVELQLVDESATRYRFEADLPRFETLALTAPETQLESLTLDLAATTLSMNETARVNVTAAFSDGTTDTVTPNATITSRDPEIARVERAAASGVSVVGVGAGETTLVANVTVGNRVVTATQPVTVRAGDDTDDETSSGGGGGGGGARSSSRAEVRSNQSVGNGQGPAYTVSLRNVYSGQQVVADFTTEQATTGVGTPSSDTWPPTTTANVAGANTTALRNVQSDGLMFTVANRGDYDLSVSARDVGGVRTNATAPNGTPPADSVDRSIDALDAASRQFVEATARRPVGFITVDHSFEPDDLETATHRFRVRKSYLAATGGTAESVRLYRAETDDYRALPTQKVDADETFHYFEAETPGFSTFVIGTDAPIFELGAPALVTADETNGRVEATVPVENVGTQAGAYTARLRGDGTVLATTTVSVPPGETVTARVQTTLPDAAGVRLSIAGRSVGEVTVTEASERTSSPAPPPDDDGSALLPSYLEILLVVVLGGIFVWIARRSTRSDDG